MKERKRCPSPSATVSATGLPYAPIHRRPPLKLPNDARVAVWTIVNVENWSPNGAMPRAVLPPPMDSRCCPTFPIGPGMNTACALGFWRFSGRAWQPEFEGDLRAQRLRLRALFRSMRGGAGRGWDFMGHGFVQKPMHKVEDQRSAIADTIAAITRFTGRPPRGWESPGLTETDETLDLLAEAGIEYVADWVLDEQPIPLKTRHGDIISVPYTVEINDVVISAVQQQPSDEILRRGRDQFDRLYLDGAKAPRVMAISIHPLSDGCAAPYQVSRDALRLHSRPRRCRDVDRGRDTRIGIARKCRLRPATLRRVRTGNIRWLAL